MTNELKSGFAFQFLSKSTNKFCFWPGTVLIFQKAGGEWRFSTKMASFSKKWHFGNMAKNPSHGSANYLVTFTPPFGYFHFCYTRHEINLNFFRAFPIIYAFFLEKVHISKKSHCNVVYCHTYGRMRRNVCLLLFL